MILDREQINRATIGAGTIIVDGKETNPNINRDESKAQEITKDVSVDKVGIEYSDNRKEWSVASIQDTLGEHVKEVLVVPLNTINEKFKLDEKYSFFESKNTQYKIIRERTDTGKLIRYLPIKLSKDTILEKGSKAHTNGMQTDLETAVREVEKHNIMKDYKDFDLKNIKPGEKIEYILFQNETRGLIGDAYESAVDKFGVKGSNKVYSKAAIEQGEFIWKNRDRIDEMTLFSQGNIQYYAAFHYIEEKYGVGALEKIKTSHYNSFGSPLNRVEFEGFLKEKGINATITSKNDVNDYVSNFVGNNPGNVIRDEEYFNNKGRSWIAYHSQYTFGQKIKKEDHRLHQKLFNITDKTFDIFKLKTYIKKGESKVENKK